MMIQLEFWQLISLLLAFFGFVAGGAKLLLRQVEKRLDTRFSTIEEAATEWRRLEREWLNWKAELPLQYVRREDYVRNQTVIEAKIDAIAVRLENWQLREKERA